MMMRAMISLAMIGGVLGRVPIIIDTDINQDVDDRIAVPYALFDRERFEVVGLTSNNTRNGGDIDDHHAELLRVARMCGPWGEVPIRKGARSSFRNLRESVSDPDLDGAEAIDFMIAQAHANENGKLVLAPIGDLSNVALAILRDSSIVPKVKVVWLGSNWPDDGEYNLNNDEWGLKFLVEESDVEFEIHTVDGGTRSVVATYEELEENVIDRGAWVHPAVAGQFGGAFHYVGNYQLSVWTAKGVEERPLFDPVALAAIHEPQWATRHEVFGATFDPETESWGGGGDPQRKIVFFTGHGASAAQFKARIWEAFQHAGPLQLHAFVKDPGHQFKILEVDDARVRLVYDRPAGFGREDVRWFASETLEFGDPVADSLIVEEEVLAVDPDFDRVTISFKTPVLKPAKFFRNELILPSVLGP